MNKNNSKKIFVKSYGCQMNVYDSNRIKNLFEPRGYSETDNVEEADIVVLNTCHIREKAVEKVYSDIGRIEKKRLKANSGKVKFVVAGCVAQAEGLEIKKRAPIVDFVVGPQSYHNLPSMIDNSEFLNDDFLQDEKFKNLLFKSSNSVSEFVSIQEGCDKFCTFCVVPYTRGSEYSRSVKEIQDEISMYINGGVKEVILLGQNVNAYHGEDRNKKSADLAYLMNVISEFENIKRIRYMTSHPNDMSESLIDAHVTNSKVMPFLHLPIQSGSDRILKKMNRKHTRNYYIKIIEKLKSKRPDIALSSDFIVGFPEETDKDFYQTMDLIEQVDFSIAYSFMYSQRPGTPAFKLNDIDKSVKKARLSALQSLLKQQQVNYNKSFVGKKIEVLFDRVGRYENQYIGRSIYNQSVFTTSNKNLIGEILNTRILRSTDFALEAIV
jgi:tRNA-2-methylthio-N6-dimethylallyladenosine synthase